MRPEDYEAVPVAYGTRYALTKGIATLHGGRRHKATGNFVVEQRNTVWIFRPGEWFVDYRDAVLDADHRARVEAKRLEETAKRLRWRTQSAHPQFTLQAVDQNRQRR